MRFSDRLFGNRHRARRKLGFWDEILGFWDFGAVLKEIVGTAEDFLNVQDSALECAIRLGPALPAVKPLEVV